MVDAADRLANAALVLDKVLDKLDAQQQALDAKIDRIVAAVEEHSLEVQVDDGCELKEKVAELEKLNVDLRAQATRLARKTLSPLVSALLAKNGADSDERLDASALDKTLQSLTVDQRIAVKAEMARAGMIE
jgi:hypothetical protein